MNAGICPKRYETAHVCAVFDINALQLRQLCQRFLPATTVYVCRRVTGILRQHAEFYAIVQAALARLVLEVSRYEMALPCLPQTSKNSMRRKQKAAF